MKPTLLSRCSICKMGAIALGVMLGIEAGASSAPIEIRVVAELRVPAGSDRALQYKYVPAVRVEEGQELYYTVYVRNGGNEAAADVTVTQPVPANTHYVADTATGAGAIVSFSVDGGANFAAPEKLQTAQGSRQARAMPEAYTHIRWHWQRPLPPGAVALLRFRAVFN